MASAAITMAGLAVLYLGILLFKWFFSYWIIRKAAKAEPLTIQPPLTVTVLQPVLSGDDGLADMLAANVVALKDAHFYWLIDDSDIAAGQITQSLCQRYPSANIKVLSFPAAPEGINPKLFKLEAAYHEVTTDICVILDDDSCLPASSLASIVAAVDEQSLVTALPYYCARQSWPSRLLTQFVNDNSAFTYLPLLPFIAPLTINGMCYAMRTEVLKSLGGFKPILHHLTDDLAMAMLAQKNNIRLVQMTAPVMVQTDIQNTKQYFRQMHRWFLFATLLMRRQTIAMNLLIFILQGLHPLLLWGLIGAGSMSVLSIVQNGAESEGVIKLIILGFTLLIRALCVWNIQKPIMGSIRYRPFMSLLSELLQPIHLAQALCNRTIRWRTRRYRVFSNDKFV